MKKSCICFYLIVCNIFLHGQNDTDNLLLAEKYFNEIQQIAQKENGNLWGKNLYGPILLIDDVNRKIYANEGDSLGVLAKEGNIYTGTIPESMQLAKYCNRVERKEMDNGFLAAFARLFKKK